MFTWIPLFKEMADWVLTYRNKQNELCGILRQIGFTGNLEDEDKSGRKPLTVIDPFTFFAFFMKMKNHETRLTYLKKLKDLAGLKSELPADFNGVPSAQPMSLWYFGNYETYRGADVIDNLWDLAEEAVKRTLSPGLFKTVLDLPRIRIAKLSQGLFWLNPNTFYPVDSHQNYLTENGINPEVKTLEDYLRIMEKVRSTFQKPFYEVSHDAWLNNNSEDQTVTNESNKKQAQSNNMNTYNTQPLNTILYGPPGTGKTYNTINKALQIVDPVFYEKHKNDRKELTTRFRKLLITLDREKPEGQIGFCTFHQSMSYEDFVEGIKPEIAKDAEGKNFLKYDVKDGIFKVIARMANDVIQYEEIQQQSVFSFNDEEFSKAIFYKMSLGNTLLEDDEEIFEYCMQNDCIALGWGGDVDYTGLNEQEVFKKAKEAKQEDFSARQVNVFVHYLKKGNYVVISKGNYRFRAIGRITGDYQYEEDSPIGYSHFRKVEWILKDVDLPVADIYEKNFQQQTLYKLKQDLIKKDFFTKTTKTKSKADTDKSPIPFVLIIDEINRGNISQIFGELITLLEDDKRAGNDEALSSTLPYSKRSFFVPPNLYIIGTMNTADRSVEALDTALRRRFVFDQILPVARLLSPKAMIVRMLNSPASWDYDWEDEPYRSVADPLYFLLGIDKIIEKRLKPSVGLNDNPWSEADLNFINNSEFIGVNLEELLNAVNSRIQKLLDIDHQIGHAFFMQVFSIELLYTAFYQKIIPQLQEYFYGDYGKIGLVLGKDFVSFENSTQKFSFGTFDYEDQQELAQKRLYTINDFKDESVDIDYASFAEAIQHVYK